MYFYRGRNAVKKSSRIGQSARQFIEFDGLHSKSLNLTVGTPNQATGEQETSEQATGATENQW